MAKDADGHPVFTIAISGDLLEALVGFCYTEKITIDNENVNEILEAASLLQFDLVQTICVKHLEGNLSISNCLGVWLIAQHYGFQHLIDQALEMAVWQFKKVVKEKEFLHMKLEPLVTILSRDDINVHSEEKIFEAMMTWIEFDESNRKSTFPALIKTVRLNYLKASVSALTGFGSSEYCKPNNNKFFLNQFLDERVAACAERLGFVSEYQIALNANEGVKCRSQAEHPELYMAKTESDEKDYLQIEQYNYRKGEWLEVYRLSGCGSNIGVVMVNNRYLYIIDERGRSESDDQTVRFQIQNALKMRINIYHSLNF